MHESPQFQFWHLVLDMELIIFILIRSFREGNFTLYHEALSGLISYFFANNNVNYARWLPVHLKDMMSLEQQHPEVAREFHKGNVVVHKPRSEFSAIAIDQAHEQNNAVIKGDGGAVGLTEDPGALWRWMVAGPELSCLIAGYEAMSGVNDAAISSKHHEQTLSAQRSFLEKTEGLHTVLKEMGNPFQEGSADLLVLDTKNIADPALAELVGTHQQRGQEQFQSFMEGMGMKEKARSTNQSRGTRWLSSDTSRLLAAQRRCWKITVSGSHDCLFPVRPDSVICKNSSRMRISPPLPLLATVANLELDLLLHTQRLSVCYPHSLAREPTRGTGVWPLLCTSDFLEPKVRVGQQWGPVSVIHPKNVADH